MKKNMLHSETALLHSMPWVVHLQGCEESLPRIETIPVLSKQLIGDTIGTAKMPSIHSRACSETHAHEGQNAKGSQRSVGVKNCKITTTVTTMPVCTRIVLVR